MTMNNFDPCIGPGGRGVVRTQASLPLILTVLSGVLFSMAMASLRRRQFVSEHRYEAELEARHPPVPTLNSLQYFWGSCTSRASSGKASGPRNFWSESNSV